MIFWLILLTHAGQTIHVGNFTTVEACQKAAEQSILVNPNKPPSTPVGRWFICVQANDSGTKPPLEPSDRPPIANEEKL